MNLILFRNYTMMFLYLFYLYITTTSTIIAKLFKLLNFTNIHGDFRFLSNLCLKTTNNIHGENATNNIFNLPVTFKLTLQTFLSRKNGKANVVCIMDGTDL